MYYIYHIPGVKIGCSKNPKHRVRNQGYSDFEILEIHNDLEIASVRERKLQSLYNYQIDSGNNVYSDKFSSMGKKGGSKNTKKQSEWRKKWGSNRAAQMKESGEFYEYQKRAWLVAGKKAVEDGRWAKASKIGCEKAALVNRKQINVYDKLNNFIASYKSIGDAAESLKITRGTISNALSKRNENKKYNFEIIKNVHR